MSKRDVLWMVFAAFIAAIIIWLGLVWLIVTL